MTRPLRLALAGTLILAAAVSAPAIAQRLHGQGMHGQGMHGQGMHGQGMHGHTMHDEVTMPGLRGLNATETESAEIAQMFREYPTLSRSVELLPDGIRTLTESTDPETRDALVSHVTGMIARVETGDDPQIFIQSPTLDILFARPGAIVTTLDITENGIAVVQTSTDPEIVAALHLHAAEVSDMAERGMQAVHERMHGG